MQSRLAGAVAIACVVIVGVLAGRPALLSAQVAERPAISVIAFSGDGVSSIAAGQMADELAARLVETGRFRVLLRDWLPTRRDAHSMSPAEVREDAASAGIQYLVYGSIRQTRSRPAVALMLAAPFLRAASMPIRAIAALQAHRSQQQSIAVSVRVIDVSTGDVVRTSAAHGDASASALAGKAPLNGGYQRALADIARTLQLPSTSTK